MHFFKKYRTKIRRNRKNVQISSPVLLQANVLKSISGSAWCLGLHVEISIEHSFTYQTQGRAMAETLTDCHFWWVVGWLVS